MRKENTSNLKSEDCKHDLQNQKFTIGELYLFHRHNPHCPPSGSLWGIYAKTEEGTIHLESSSRGLRHYRIGHSISSDYRYCRRATRAELRDYMYNLAAWEYAHRLITHNFRV